MRGLARQNLAGKENPARDGPAVCARGHLDRNDDSGALEAIRGSDFAVRRRAAIESDAIGNGSRPRRVRIAEECPKFWWPCWKRLRSHSPCQLEIAGCC